MEGGIGHDFGVVLGWCWVVLCGLVPCIRGGIGHDFGVVLGWYWVVLGGIGEHVAHVQRNSRDAECIGNPSVY